LTLEGNTVGTPRFQISPLGLMGCKDLVFPKLGGEELVVVVFGLLSSNSSSILSG